MNFLSKRSFAALTLIVTLAPQSADAYVFRTCTTTGGVQKITRWAPSVTSIDLHADPESLGCNGDDWNTWNWPGFIYGIEKWKNQSQTSFGINLISHCGQRGLARNINDGTNSAWIGGLETQGAIATLWQVRNMDTCHLIETDLVVNGSHLYGQLYTIEWLKGVVTHEVGHAFGLDHEDRFQSCMGSGARGALSHDGKKSFPGLDTDCSTAILSQYGALPMSRPDERVQWKMELVLPPKIKGTNTTLPLHGMRDVASIFKVAPGSSITIPFRVHRLATTLQTPQVQVSLVKSSDDLISATDPVVKEKFVTVPYSTTTGASDNSIDLTIPADAPIGSLLQYGLVADRGGTYRTWDDPADNSTPLLLQVVAPTMKIYTAQVNPAQVPTNTFARIIPPAGTGFTEAQIRQALDSVKVGPVGYEPQRDLTLSSRTDVLEVKIPVLSALGQQQITAVASRIGVTLKATFNIKSAPPVVKITGPSEVRGNGTATLSSSKSSDPDGHTLFPGTWSLLEGPGVASASATETALTFTAPAAPAELKFGLEMRDATGLPGSATHIVSVKLPPTAQGSFTPAAPNPGANVTLSSAGSVCPASGPSYQWRQISGSPTVTLTAANTANASFVAPAAGGDFGFELTLRDGLGQESRKQVSLHVNRPPVATVNPTSLTLRSGRSGAIDASASRDPEGGALTYRWRQLSPTATLALSGATSARVVITAPRVTASSAQTLELTVRDAQGAVTLRRVKVTLNP